MKAYKHNEHDWYWNYLYGTWSASLKYGCAARASEPPYPEPGNGHVVELIEKPENGNITSEEAVSKVLREAKRYADDYISEDKLKFEIKTALNAYKPTEKPAPVEVSAKADKMLDNLKQEILRGITEHSVLYWVRELHDCGLSESDIFRALDVGWVVKPETLYNVKVPHTKNDYYCKNVGEVVTARGSSYNSHDVQRFTLSEIHDYGLDGCEREEVSND